MAFSNEQLKTLHLANSAFVLDRHGQPTWGVYNDGQNFYNLVAQIVDDLDVGTGTLVSNTLTDNGNGTYTWTPISGTSFLINTHASSNPINNIMGLTATDVQRALEELYTAISGAAGFTHPAVTLAPGSNSALSVDLTT